MSSYQSNLDNATRREQAAQQALADVKARTGKLQLVSKSAQKNAALVAGLLKKKRGDHGLHGAAAKRHSEAAELERASTRVKDVIAALKKTADIRRDHMNEKKSNSVSSAWVQSFPALHTSLKKSLWHRMHRRKQQIVLRPTEETILNELRNKVATALTALQHSSGSRISASRKREATEEALRKAEQKFLLATHPFSEEYLPTVPSSKSGENWAEPGWHLLLDVPERNEEEDISRILPCRQPFLTLEKNLAEIESAPGNQSASFLRPAHFRCLSSPLSAFAVASSPAETGAALAAGSKCAFLKSISMRTDCPTNIHSLLLAGSTSEGDPLIISEDDMSAGYLFSMKPALVKQPPARRKSSTAVATAVSAASSSQSLSSTKSASTSRKQPITETKHRHELSVDTLQTSNTSSSAPVQRRKSDTAKKRRPSKTSVQRKPSITHQPQETQQPPQPPQPPQQLQQQQLPHQHQSQQPQPKPSQQQNPSGTSRTDAPAPSPRPSIGREPIRGSVDSQQAAAAAAAAAAHFYQTQMPMQQQSGAQRRPSQPQQQNMPPYMQQGQPPQQQQQPPPQNQQQAHYQTQQQQRQIAQLRMMQQQAAAAASSPSHRPPQLNTAFPPHQAMQMQQFYAPLGHPNAPGQFQPNISPMHMQQRPSLPGVPPHNANQPPQPQQQQPPQPQQQQTQPKRPSK